MAKTIKEEDLRLNIIVGGDDARRKILDLEESIKQTTATIKENRAELKRLEKSGQHNQKEISSLKKSIVEQEAALADNKQELAKQVRQLSINSMTIAELRKQISTTRTALENAVPGSENWNRLQKDLVRSRSRLAELTAGASATNTTLCGFAQTINRYAGLITGAIASWYKVSGSVQQATDAFLEYDEAITDMMKTTNLSRTEADELSEALKKIDTRTAQNELLSLARIGGKLGVEGRDNLLGFVRAADKINVALGEDLGGDAEAAIAAIGKMVDIFNLEDQFGLEKALLKVGSAVNSLGMASTANEGYIVDLTRRLAGIAPNADISIDKILGLAATLDKYGQTSEMSATAIGQTIIAMYKRTDTFAKIAGLSSSEFAEILGKDVNEALIRVLEGIKGSDNSMASMVVSMNEMKLDGQRAQQVLGALAKHTDELRNQQLLANQAFVDGTSVIEEYDVKNTSAMAGIEKLKNNITNEVAAIGEQLLPIQEKSLEYAEVGVKMISKTLKVIIEYKAVLLALAAAYGSYKAVILAANIAKSAEIALGKLKFFWSKTNRKAMAEEMLMIKRHTDLQQGLTAKTYLLAAAKNLLAGNATAAGVALKLFGKALKASMGPVGWIVLAIEAAAGAYALFSAKSKEARKAQKELEESNNKLKDSYTDTVGKINQEKEALDKLKEKVDKAKVGTQERAAAIKEINDKYGSYLPALLSEKSSNEDVAAALEKVNIQLANKIKLQARETEEQRLYQERMEQVKKTVNDYADLYKEINGKDMSVEQKKSLATAVTNYSAAQTNPNASRESRAQAVNEANEVMSGLGLDNKALSLRMPGVRKKGYRIASMLQNFNSNQYEQRSMLDSYYGTVESLAPSPSAKPDSPVVSGTESGGTVFSSGGGDGKWSLDKDEGHMQQVLDLKEKYAAKEIASEDEYRRQVLELEIKSLEDRIASNQESGEELLKLKGQLADKRIALEEHVAKEEEKKSKEAERRAKESAELINEVNNDKVEAENRRYWEERKKFEGNSEALQAVERKHQANLRKIMLDGISEREAAAERERDIAVATARNRHAEELASFQGTRRELKALKKQQALELAQIDMDYVNEMKNILDDVLQIKSDLTTDGEVTVAFEGISDAELDAVRLKLQEIIALKNKVDGTSAVAESKGSDTSSTGSSGGETSGPSLAQGLGGGELFGVSQDQWQAFFDNLSEGKFGAEGLATAVQAVGGAAQGAMKLASMWADRQTAIENKQLKEYEKSNDKKKKALQARLDAGLITEAQYNTEVERMDAEFDAYQEELQLKQAKRQKQMQLTQAIINTALGVTMTLAQWGVPWGLIPAGIMAAMGAAEIALIASTPITAGAEEGGFGGEVIRSQDGKRFKARLSPDKRGFVDSPTLLVSENGREYVIPKEGLDNPTLLPFINTMETARRNGRLKSLNFEAIYPVVQGRASGGFVSVQAAEPEIRTAYRQDPELKEVLTKLAGILSRPISAQVSMLGKNGIIEKQKEYERYRQRGRL